MKQFFSTTWGYIIDHKRRLLPIAVGVVVILGLTALLIYSIYSNPHRVAYQPVDACQLLTPERAGVMLGDKMYGVNTTKPEITGDVATSKCSYSDRNPNLPAMTVAALAVRSGINDSGAAKTKADFTASQQTRTVQVVDNVGDRAYYDSTLGQLNILSGRSWLIISYGVGEAPATNTLANAVTLANLVLPSGQHTTPKF